MNIVKQLYENGERFGFVVEDGNTTYEIPTGGLYVKAVYKSLTESGYRLVDKDDHEMICNGMKLSQLPIEEGHYADYAEAFKRMLSLPMEENLVVSATTDTEVITSRYPTKYTINTRADFIAYLDSISDGVSDTDFMPVNYFVAPTARFTPDELKSGSYSTYLERLNNRRSLSYNRYKALKKVVASVRGIPLKDVTYTTVNEYYFSFGIDGVALSFESDNTRMDVSDPFNSITVSESAALLPSMKESQVVLSGFHKRITCLAANGASDILFPSYLTENERKSARYAELYDMSTHVRAGAGEYVPLDFVIPVRHLIREMFTVDGDEVIITPFRGCYHSTKTDEYGRSVSFAFPFLCLRVRNPAVNGVNIPINEWDRGDDYFLMQAKLAASVMNIYKHRIPDDAPSCYDILLDMGLSPAAAVSYIAAESNYLNCYNVVSVKKDDAVDREDNRLIMTDDVRAFFAAPTVDDAVNLSGLPSYVMSDGTMVDDTGMVGPKLPVKSDDIHGVRFVTGEERVGFIIDIINGDAGPGEAPLIRERMIHPDVREHVKALQAVIDCLGLDADYVIQLCEDFAVKSVTDYVSKDVPTVITFDNNGKRVSVGKFERPYDVEKASMELRASLMSQRFDEAEVFYLIDDVAYELTNDPRITKRPIAIHGVKCKKAQDPAVKEILGTLYEEFIEQFGEETLGRLTIMNLVRRVYLELFRRNGDLTSITGLPKEWYQPWAGHNWQTTINHSCGVFYDSLACVTEESYRFVRNGVAFRNVCVNAEVYPDNVIPHGKEVIHEVPLREVIHADEVQKFIFGNNDPNYTPALAKAVSHFYAPYMCSAADLWCITGAQHLQNTKYGFDFDDKPIYDNAVYEDIHSAINRFNYSGIDRTPENLERIYDEVCAKSARHALLASYDMEFYFYRAFRRVISNNESFVAPTHPASIAYPWVYPSKPGIGDAPTTGIDTFRPVCKAGDAYVPAEGYHLFVTAGKLYDNDTCSYPTHAVYKGEEHLVSRNLSKAALPANISHGSSITRAFSMESRDLIMDSNLAFFADNKDTMFIVEPSVGVTYVTADGKATSYTLRGDTSIADLASLDSSVAPIYHINNGVHYIYDYMHNLYRVEVL